MDSLFKKFRPDGVPTSVHRAPSATATQRTIRNTTVGADHGGQFGTYIHSYGGGNGGTFGANTGYMTVEMPLVYGGNVLFSPTNKGADGACLEVGSGYNYATQGAQVYAFDFCDGSSVGSFHKMKDIDATFRSLYERNFGDGLPSYFYETVRNPDGRWTAYLYDYTDSLWLPFYTSVGSTLNPVPAAAQGDEGWDIFETHFFNPGACPYVPEIHSFATQYYNRFSGTWDYLENEPGAQFEVPVTQSGVDCLSSDDGSGAGYWYALGYNVGLHDWTVDAWPSIPPYTGGGGGGDPGCDPSIDDCCAYDPALCLCDDPTICCDLYGSGCCDTFVDTTCSLDYRRKVTLIDRRRSQVAAAPLLMTQHYPDVQYWPHVT